MIVNVVNMLWILNFSNYTTAEDFILTIHELFLLFHEDF